MLTARSLRRRRSSVSTDRHAATGTLAGAPTSFQPDCQVPPWAMLRVMFRNASPSSWRGATERADVDRVEADRADELEHRGLRGVVVAGDEPVELDAVGDRVRLVRGEERVERLDDVRASGSSAASSSALEEVVSISGPSAPNDDPVA